MLDAAALLGRLVYSPACHVMSNHRLVTISVGDNTVMQMLQSSQTQAGLLLASKHGCQCVLGTDLQIVATN